MDLTGALYWIAYMLLIAGACTDLLWLKISNVLVGLLVLVFGAAVLVTDREISLVSQIVPAVILLVGAGIVPADITVTRDDVDLLITHSNLTDEVRVQGWYANGNGQFLQMRFDDGSVISPSEAVLPRKLPPLANTRAPIVAIAVANIVDTIATINEFHTAFWISSF